MVRHRAGSRRCGRRAALRYRSQPASITAPVVARGRPSPRPFPMGQRTVLRGAEVRHNARMAATADAADCVFSDIVAGREPASVVYSDETVLTFLDNGPVTT